MPSDVKARAEKAIAEKVFPGCVVGVVKKSGEREVRSFGNLTYDTDAPAVREDTIYDLASVTKSIPTASLALNFLNKEKFELSDGVKKFIPELQNDHGATIEDLLMYRVRGVQMSTLKDKTPEEISGYIFAHGFDAPPGKSEYTNLPGFLLGLVVERALGESLDALAQKYFFDPLKMSHTTFFPNVRLTKSNISPTEVDVYGEVRGIVHDESARVFAKAGRAVGHAGLFSNAPDILNILEALLQGKYPSVVEGAQRGLGWQTAEPWFSGSHIGKNAFGKTGFTGTSVLVDIERGIALVILSNRTYPKRPPDAASIHSAMNTFRADIADILLVQ